MTVGTEPAAPSIASLRALQKSIGDALDAYEATANKQSDDALEHLVDISGAARQLGFETQNPTIYLYETVLAQSGNAAVKCAYELEVFEQVPLDQEGDVTLNDLAQRVGAAPDLLVRIMRTLVTMRLVRENGLRRYSLTPTGAMLKTAKWRAMFWMGFEHFNKVWAHVAEFLRHNKWQSPTDTTNGPHHWAFQTKQGVFEWFAADPSKLQIFYDCMSTIEEVNRKMKVPWNRLVEGVDPDEVALVDVGGGDGAVMRDIVTRFPELTGRLILQDQAHTIASIPPGLNDKRVELKAHNFFETQPVKGARAYHLRHVFHDWPDRDCRRILQAVKPAMKPGYSRLFISDIAAEDIGATTIESGMDWSMMCLSAGERTIGQLKGLLESEGFVIKEVIRGSLFVDAFVIAELTEGATSSGA